MRIEGIGRKINKTSTATRGIRKLSDDTVREILNLYLGAGRSKSSIASEMKLNYETVASICRGETYKDVPRNDNTIVDRPRNRSRT